MTNYREDLSEQEQRIVRQEALIERLTKAGVPVDKAIDSLLQMQLLRLDMRGRLACEELADAP